MAKLFTWIVLKIGIFVHKKEKGQPYITDHTMIKVS